MSCCTLATKLGPPTRGAALPEAAGVVVGDLTTIAGMRQVADAANAMGHFDAVIHNAAVGSSEPRRIVTPDGLSHVFAVNVLAPYLLTAEIEMPRRLVYLSSGMHRGGNPHLGDLQWEHRRWNGAQAYSDSKLFVAVLAAAVARLRADVLSNAVDPGWVATKMGGPGAPDDLVPGFGHPGVAGRLRRRRCPCVRRLLLPPAPLRARTPRCTIRRLQEELLGACAGICGVACPAPRKRLNRPRAPRRRPGSGAHDLDRRRESGRPHMPRGRRAPRPRAGPRGASR